ncbi:MAG: trypsin-like serine protease [Crocinitomix sp.]|nr:trypsin-like serine protease [Crocinitomix sp.]
MRFLFFIALFSCSQLFAADVYTFIGSANADTKVYLSNGEPLFYHDTLIFDEDIIVLLGQGTFKRKLTFPTGTPFKDYTLIFEHPQDGYLSYNATFFLNKADRVFMIDLENEPETSLPSTGLPITINIGDVNLNLLNSSSGSGRQHLGLQYHTGYSASEKSSFNYFEAYLSSQMEFVLDEFGSNAPENEKYDVIPDLTLDCSIIEESSASGYYRSYHYDLILNLLDSDSIILTKIYPENEFARFDTDYLKNRYWFISKIRSFIGRVNLEELREKYSAAFAKTQQEWPVKKMLPVKNTSMKNTVVTIKGEYGHGSGVVISKDGYILTNHHVINNESTLTVITNDKVEILAEVVRFNKQYDIALIKATNHDFLHVAEVDQAKERNEGTSVVCIGSPLSEFLDGSISEGFISGKYQKREYLHYIVSANINPGNSGGGLFTIDGKLIGIVNAKIVGYSNHNIGFVIPIEVIKNELKISF